MCESRWDVMFQGVRGRFVLSLLAVGMSLIACGEDVEGPVAEDEAAETNGGRITARVASKVSDLSTTPPDRGHFRVHMIDVGSGLAILVQGHDFNMLFDGGSGDDARGITQTGNKSRLLAYLYAAIGPSGDPACEPEGDERPARTSKAQLTIDHVFLSHPHDDHVASLDDVIRCYKVENVWEPGMGYDNQKYGRFLKAVSEESGVRYHTVLPVPGNRSQRVADEKIAMPASVHWTSFDENKVVTLGSRAKFKILHVDATSHEQNANLNSLAVRVDLGDASLLLLGDTMAGAPTQPLDAEPSLGEGALLERHRAELKVDILQIGHHGSPTSSRAAFLDAVKPKFGLLSVGPRPFSGEVLPAANVVRLLRSKIPQLLRTDQHDKAGCPVRDRIGVDDDSPGGCDNHVLEIAP
jgi:competence protein ComEC